MKAIGLTDTMIENTIRGKNALKSILATLDFLNINECDKKVSASIKIGWKLALLTLLNHH